MTCPIFVGRSDELAALNEARRGLAQSRGRVVLVGGEAGVGKTRLLAQFLGTVARDPRPRHLASVECIERAERPFGPFRELIGALGGTFDVFSEAPFDKTEIFARAFDFFTGLAAKRATILSIEDLQWADRSSLELLAYLAARIGGTRLLIIATYRTEDVERDDALVSASRLWAEPAVARSVVEALDDGQTRELIRGTLDGRADVPEPEREEIVRRSEGNPFFAEELLKAAAEARTGRAAKLPVSIRATIAARLSMLSTAERDVVSHAAVLGFRFDPEALALTLGTDLDAVMPALRRGRDLNIFVEEAQDRVRFRFRHALMREVAYESLLAFDARRTHARILRALEAVPDTERHVDALAYHAWAARDAAKTISYGERAGDEALAIRALPEARTFFERALEACATPGDEARISARLGNVLELQGAMGESMERLEAALARYRALGEIDRAADVIRQLSAIRNNTGDVGSVAAGKAFLDEYWERISLVSRDALVAMLARLAMIQYDMRSARAFLARLTAPEDLPPRAAQNIIVTRLELAFLAGDVPEYRIEVQRLFETATGTLPPLTALSALYTTAQGATWLGLTDIANELLARAGRLEARGEFNAIAFYAGAVRAMAAYYRGDLAAARAAIVSARRGAEVAVARMALALVAPLVSVALGEPDLVSPLVEGELSELRRTATTPDDAMLLAAAAALALERGNPRSAQDDLRAALSCLPRILASAGTILGLAAEHLPAEDLAPLRALLDEPLLPQDVAGHAHASLVAALLARRFESIEAATAHARTAAARYRELGHPLFEAWALEVANDFAAARKLYVRSGAAGDVRRLDARDARSSGPVDKLSEREAAVARAIASGATNAQIADGLSISVRTVEKHVAAIFAKLGLRSRSQIAAAFARDSKTAAQPAHHG